MPLAWSARGLTENAEEWLKETVLGMAAAHRARIEELLPDRRRWIARGYDYKTAELMAWRRRVSPGARRGDASARAELAMVKEEQSRLVAEKKRKLASLDTEPSLIEPGPAAMLAHALVVPTDDPDERQRHDAEVEAIAMRLARAHEEAAGAAVRDPFGRLLAKARGSVVISRSEIVSGAEEVKATTIHGHCFGILMRDEVLASTGRVPRPLMDFEQRFLLEDLRGDGFGTIHKKRKRLKAFEAAGARLQDEQPGWPTDATDKAFQAALLDWLRFHRAMLIGELVPEALRYLRNNPASRHLDKFEHILVDEYQDLNVAEQEVISLLAKDAELTIIGDEDQSIYSFKHAYPEGIEDFHRRHAGTEDETLDMCRRCPTTIVGLANELIGHNNQRTNRVLLPHVGKGQGEVHIVQWPSIAAEAEGLARFIQRRIAEERVQPGRILVLAPRRAFGYAVRDALNAIDVPAHSFFQEQALEGDPKSANESKKQQAFTLLTLSVDPTDATALRCWCGFGSQNLREPAWTRVRELCNQSNRALGDVIADIRDGRVPLPHGGSLRSKLVELQERLQDLGGLIGRDLVDALFPADDPDFGELRELADGLSGDADPKALLNMLRTSITQPELPTDVAYVRVMSLHKSKGLTTDLVVVMGCVEGLVPHVDDSLTQAGKNRTLEEQRRLFYVALTRSRDTLILSSVTNLPRPRAHRLQVRITGRGQNVSTITSRFIDELGPTRPDPVHGARLLEATRAYA